MSKLLINEYPIIIQPSLVMKIGLNQAIILQQLHYWLETSSHIKDGKRWIYNTYKDWQQQFPFWSEKTIQRTFLALEEEGYVVSANYNRMKMDKTKWYTIDYDKLREIEADFVTSESGQSVRTQGSNESPINDSLGVAIPEINTETNTERIYTPIPIQDIVTYLNQKANAHYRISSKKTKELIKARWNEGFRMDDFKKVIDIKVLEWMDDPVMSKFLRPETLFGTKFESYLNQRNAKKKKSYHEEDFDLD
ncbi:conserved phage C-terminal domain-containing protein [Niallia sp. Krafla_26]|uniref:conserved phage C-terminal domain-containing protein n=1 Tax=Niallia sp. Krafla_26 TaxID=3064703 RepID=UPI003D1808FC